MASSQAERPRYFQGQYLGPEDLAAAVDHARWARARHDLGAHAWGIAAGLGLRETEALAGGVDVFVEPGYAVDGFGRPLAITSPLPVPLDRLRALKAPAEGTVPVWLRYVESQTAEAPFGFTVCEGDETFERTLEGVEVVVGAFAADEARDQVVVGGEEMDAIEALRSADDEAPLLRDASVPFQVFPDVPERWWLVPLGVVRWDPAAGQIVETTEADRREGRRLRRYLGVVAEGVWAAGDLIRLRSRLVEPAAGVGNLEACADERPLDTGALDMAYDAATGRVTFQELLWVEGSMRLLGDARLFGGKLELRDPDGDDHGVPMWVRRVETSGFVDAAGDALPGRDLEVLVGSTSDADGRNRLVIGAAPADPADVPGRVVVQNDGRVGIRTLDPPGGLASPLTIRALEGGDEELLTFELADGSARKWDVSQRPGGDDGLSFNETGVLPGRLFLAAGGDVGFSTTTPGARIDVAGAPATSGALWLRIGEGGDSGRFWVEYGAQNAPLLVMSDRDDPPRIRFQQTGAGDEATPAFSSWIGHARANSAALAVMDGFLGVGTTDPQARLHVDGGSDAVLATGASGYLMLGAAGGTNLLLDDNEIMARNNGAAATLHLQAEGGALHIHSLQPASQAVVVTAAGRVGIGTAAPADALEVRGNVRMGSAGDLFAIAALQNLRVVAGLVNNTAGASSGTGFSWNWTAAGRCTVSFAPVFSGTPVVVATAFAAPGDDHVVTVASMAPGSFNVVTADVEEGGVAGDLQSTRFTFIAIGTR